jgi:hypothetical protein
MQLTCQAGFFHFSPSNCWLFHSLQFYEVVFIAPCGQKHSLTIAISHRLAGRAVLCTPPTQETARTE